MRGEQEHNALQSVTWRKESENKISRSPGSEAYSCHDGDNRVKVELAKGQPEDALVSTIEHGVTGLYRREDGSLEDLGGPGRPNLCFGIY